MKVPQLLPLAVAVWIGGALGIVAGVLVRQTVAKSLPVVFGTGIGAIVAVAVGFAVGIRIYERLRDQ